MYAAHDDCLLHTFESHTKEEESGYLDVAWQIHKDLAKSCDFGLLLFFSCGKVWRYSKSTSLLEILDCITDVSKLWRLDSSS